MKKRTKKLFRFAVGMEVFVLRASTYFLARLFLCAALFGCASPETARVGNRETPPETSRATSFIQHGNTIHGDMQHIASGQIFPNLVAGFLRLSTRAYDQVGRDVSAEYVYLVTHTPLVAIVRVFPFPAALPDGTSDDRVAATRAEFERQERGIAVSYPGRVLLGENPVTMVANGETLRGLHVTYDVAEPSNRSSAGRTAAPTPLRSELFGYCCVGSAFAIQYRFTYPRGLAAGPAIDRFMRALIEVSAAR